MKKTKKLVLSLCAALALGGCGDLTVPDLNNPGIESFEQSPTRAGMSAAATGLLLGNRAIIAPQNGYVAQLGILGREAYVLDAGDPRYITEMLAGLQLDPGSPAFGGNFWTGPYANIANANLLLRVLDKVPGTSATEKEAVRGFAKTLQAMDFLTIVNTRDSNGAPIEVDRPLDAPLAPIVGKAEVLAHIARLLDEGKAHLEAAGTSFPFPLGDGFSGLSTPATFLKFNRAIKARVDVYRQDWNQALVDVSQSFINPSPTGNLDAGAYYTFAGNPGDTTNGLNSPNIFAHPSVVADADKKANGQVDDRVARKTLAIEKPRTLRGLTGTTVFTMYEKPDDWVPIIRNEELLLLRAEANIGLGNIGPAAEDINEIRRRSGGLEGRTDLTADNILDELLKQRRYSLLMEGGHRWIDMRRYGKLDQLPKDLEGHRVHSAFPIPTTETDARP